MGRWVLAAVVLAVVVVGVLSRPFDTVDRQPAPDAQSYAQLADHLGTGVGYRVTIAGEPEASRYPPGLPVMLAPFIRAGIPAERVAQGFTVALLVAVWALAIRLGGPVAGAVAVLLVGTSRSLLAQSAFVMADLTVALLTVCAAWCVVSGRERLAGVLAGWATWTRLAAVVTIAGMRRRAWVPFVVLAAALAVVKLATGFGYVDGQVEWSVRHLFTADRLNSPDPRGGNVWAYATMLAGVGGTLTWPGALLVGVWGAWTRPGGRWALTVCACTALVYLPYFYQAERFMFPVLALLSVYAGAAVGSGLGDQRRGSEEGG